MPTARRARHSGCRCDGSTARPRLPRLRGDVAGGAVELPGTRYGSCRRAAQTTVDRIVSFDGDLPEARAGQSVTLTLADKIVSRGDVIAAAGDPPEAADQFEATIVWMADEPMLPGRAYVLQLGTQAASATLRTPKYQVNVNTLEQTAARTLELNAIGVATLALDRPVVFEPYEKSRELGGFILVDKATNATVAAGMIRFALRRAANVHRQHLDVTRERRAGLKNQKTAVLWFTGLSGAGEFDRRQPRRDEAGADEPPHLPARR
ncbi:elongation factor 1-alpha C-terminal domain-related protein [Sphingomonas sp. MMS24-JH45]